MPDSTMTRERWLLTVTAALRADFVNAGADLPSAVHCSIGFPSTRALSTRNQRIGECWHGTLSADGAPHLYISPLIADGARVADILVHELCHAALPVGTGHRAPFARLARAVGLTGKMTATTATPELASRLNELIAAIGPYPHAALAQGARVVKKQSARLIKVTCEADDYIARVSRATLSAHGTPICPACGLSMTDPNADAPDDDPDDPEGD